MENSEEERERWDEEETLALLKIKTLFLHSNWDHISRRLAELGYDRSAKKCKEKFENIYKHHKRTKELGHRNGKNYHFFEQLEIFCNASSNYSPSPNETQLPSTEATNAMRISGIDTPMIVQPLQAVKEISTPRSTPKSSSEIMTSTSASITSSSGDRDGKKKKNKFANYVDRLMKEVLERQEKMQKMFIDALEKCENDRIEREEAWKAQESARIKREEEILAHERAVSKAKDAAMVSLLQKISEQGIHFQLPDILLNPSPITQISIPPSRAQKIPVKREISTFENSYQASSSKWPKAEIEALIRLRTELDIKYQDTGPKGPLWEEVSQLMEKIGYTRNAKRCKEKWENINKYFRRMKGSNKRRPEDSKTCPYYNMLESIYEKKHKKADNGSAELKPDDILMQMQHEQERMLESVVREDGESEKIGQNREDDENYGYGENGNGDEVVPYNTSSIMTENYREALPSLPFE